MRREAGVATSPPRPARSAQGQRTRRAPGSGPTRLARIAVFTAVALTLASLAHLGAGATRPGVVALVLGALVVGVGALVISARACRFRVIALALGGAQALLHALFVALPDPGPVAAGVAGVGHAGHVLPLAHTGHAAPVAAHAHAPSVQMVALHVLATLLTAALMAYGERLLWELVRGLAPTLPGVGRPPRPVTVSPQLGAARTPIGWFEHRSPWVRGPPMPARG